MFSNHIKVNALFICCLLFIGKIGNCQFIKLATNKINLYHNKDLICFDSSQGISNNCSIDLNRFKVKFYEAKYDKPKKGIRLVGRVYLGNELNQIGLSDVEIIKAVRKGSKILSKNKIGETTNGGNIIENDGFFDINVQIGKEESLFFGVNGYFIEMYELYKLFSF
jgi:hypothetical protein